MRVITSRMRDDGERGAARPSKLLLQAVIAYAALLIIGLVALEGVSRVSNIFGGREPDSPVQSAPQDPSRAWVIAHDAGPVPRPEVAIQSPASWVTTDDYPAGAIRDGLAGTVGMRFVVGTNGRVTGCTIMASTGSSLLDKTACGLVEDRARYFPARDQAGRARTTIKTLRFTWRLPDS